MQTTENVDLMKQAREALRGKWGLAIGTFLVYMLLVGAVNAIPFVGPVASLVVTGPMSLGVAIFSLSLARRQEAKLEQLFDGFQHFMTSMGAYLLMLVFIVLWTLLLIVPGIIAAISYSMTFFIISEDRSLDAMSAINKSKKMMYGYKWKYFCLQLRFLGWALLCILTLGIGFLWLIPYVQVTNAIFYDDIKNRPFVEAAPIGSDAQPS